MLVGTDAELLPSPVKGSERRILTSFESWRRHKYGADSSPASSRCMFITIQSLSSAAASESALYTRCWHAEQHIGITRDWALDPLSKIGIQPAARFLLCTLHEFRYLAQIESWDAYASIAYEDRWVQTCLRGIHRCAVCICQFVVSSAQGDQQRAF